MQHKSELYNGVVVPYGESVKRLLEQAKMSSASQNWGAFLALADNDSQESINGLVCLFESETEWIRRAAVFAIGENQNGANAAYIVHKALEDKSFPIMSAAISAAAKLKLLDTNLKIVELLKGGEAIQEVALSALTEIWQPSNFSPVFRVFLKARNKKNRKQAAWTLRRTADNNSWEKLFEAWQGDEVPRHRVWACELIEAYGSDSSAERLSNLKVDKDGHVRHAAAKAFTKLTK